MFVSVGIVYKNINTTHFKAPSPSVYYNNSRSKTLELQRRLNIHAIEKPKTTENSISVRHKLPSQMKKCGRRLEKGRSL